MEQYYPSSKKRKLSMVDSKWSELLLELLQGIRSRVLKNSIADYICFGAVLVICDIRTSSVVQQIHLPDSRGEHCHFYLVESSEELLLFAGRLCPNSKEIMGFNAFQLDQSSRKWSEVKNLGGRTVFLSELSSISLLASNHPGTKLNCIYFLPSRVKKHYKVFSLKDDSIEDFPLDAKLYGIVNVLLDSQHQSICTGSKTVQAGDLEEAEERAIFRRLQLAELKKSPNKPIDISDSTGGKSRIGDVPVSGITSFLLLRCYVTGVHYLLLLLPETAAAMLVLSVAVANETAAAAIRSRVLKNSVVDYIRFGVICKPWGSAIVEKPRCLPPQIPLTMISFVVYFKTISSCFYSLDSKNLYRCERERKSNYGMATMGYDHGWMFTVGHDHGWMVTVGYNSLGFAPSLVNPITGDEILLPSLNGLDITVGK
ncbi:hypothetical protein GIB67_026793 [Kingdonia uniflora]|uniref:KIB1-4 beta-propeller domain-containing protein n=1 Tax=Kingdonia uniflora TaxID=39325 RepID=A0A7J7MHJ6_9MAGN|nr:hypothetical protein GIB67_026793 [Kingdonia uniflora]